MVCSPLLPPEISEIAAYAVKPLGRNKFKKLFLKKGDNPLPLFAAMENEVAKSLLATAHQVRPTADRQSQHREGVAPAGDQLNPLIAWYSLVATPIPRKLWATMPKAQAAVDAEWLNYAQRTEDVAPGTSPQ